MVENFKKRMIKIKSYNGLFEKMISDDNIKLALLNAGRNKHKNNYRHKKLRHIKANVNSYMLTAREWAENFEPSKHRQMVTYAGFAKIADCKEWFREHVLKYVSIKNLRHKISKYDRQRRLALCGQQLNQCFIPS